MPFVDDFDGPELDRDAWLPHYLPHWSSRAESVATYAVEDSELRLTIPPEQGLWCADTHDDPPLRVSGVQSGSWSGPAGSTRGQQRFREGQVVLEAQERFEGWLPSPASGPAGLMPGKASNSMASATTPSSRASGAPRQKCRPWPNDRWPGCSATASNRQARSP